MDPPPETEPSASAGSCVGSAAPPPVASAASGASQLSPVFTTANVSVSVSRMTDPAAGS